MPSVENAVGRVQGSGPPHYSGIRFGIRFRVPIRSHPINIAESPEYGRPPPVGWSPNRVRSGRPPIRSHPINPIRSSPAGGVRELHGSGRCTLPFRGGNIKGRPAGGGPFFSGTAGTCRVRVRNPGALRGRLGAGVVAYVPLIRALVTLSRAPRETVLYPVHCSLSSLPGRYASAAYPPAGGGTTGNMPRIPGGGVPGMLRYVAGRPRRSSSVRCFGMVRHASLRGDTPYWLAMARYDTPGVRRYASVCVGSGCPVWLVMVRFAGVRECAASRHLLWSVEEPGLIWRVFSRGPGRRIPDRLTMSRYVAPPARAIPGVRVIFPEYRAAPGRVGA